MTFFISLLSMLPVAIIAYGWGRYNGRTAATAATATEDKFPEPTEQDDDEEDENVDVCLRPGAHVVCNLSDTAHTHGILVGFTMGNVEGPMLALVDLGGNRPLMPIDVDCVEPVSHPEVGYRENADPSKNWN